MQVDPWPPGNFGFEDEHGLRVSRAIAFARDDLYDNGYAHPIEGLVVLVDLNRMEVLRVDDHGIVPIPQEPGRFDASAVPTFRSDLKPLEIVQPEGPSFVVDGHEVSWQRWRFRVGFNGREGLVLHQLQYSDEGRWRPILHRASISEMTVPYGDPSPIHFFKSVFDAGENGIGIAATSLQRGCDCLGEIRYFDAVVCDQRGEPVPIHNAICMHEEDYGVLWRHIDWRHGKGEVRRSRRLVISSFSTIGNYDYGFFWYLYQDGTIELEVKLTGVLSTGAVRPGEQPRHGELLAPELNGMVHQHFFNARLDFDIDGTSERGRRDRGSADAAGPRQSVRKRVHHDAAALPHRTRGAAAHKPADRASVGDRQPGAHEPGRAPGGLPADTGRERPSDGPAGLVDRQARRVYQPAPVGDPLSAG